MSFSTISSGGGSTGLLPATAGPYQEVDIAPGGMAVAAMKSEASPRPPHLLKGLQ